MLLPKTFLVCSILLLYSYQSSNALIVPQELPSILSLIYSNIPPIKKGTDSRLGFGFRLGEHADFQVLVELGPQKETRPIGDQDEQSSFNKRHISKSEQNALLRQQLQQQLQRLQKEQEQQQAQTSTERNAENWLENWSQDMNAYKKKPTKSKSKQELKKQTDKNTFAPTIPVVPSASLQQLQLLYKMATTTTSSVDNKTTLTSSSPIENAERLARRTQITKELMDVSLEQGE